MSFLNGLRNILRALIEPPQGELAPGQIFPTLSYPTRPLTYPGDVFEIPVVAVCYYPVKGGNIDIRMTGDVGGPLEATRQHVRGTTKRVISALEQGSIYHGYKDPAALPSLRYRVVESIEFMEPLPTWNNPRYTHVPMTDYNAIMDRINVRQWVEERGVKEVWVWGYHGNVVGLWESNMAGPYGDISNSDRDPNDLPTLSKTYTVYHYNYQRGPSEATEDHMHQIEAVLRHADKHSLFWEKFVGKTGEGRCGWSHYPPNAIRDYEWASPRTVLSDIEDWKPEGGPKQPINATRWGGDSLTWFIYWMQNLPGRDNGMTYRGHPLTNWWTFIGDFDRAMASGMRLITED